MIVEDIPLDDSATIDNHEMTSIRVFPELLERIHLCRKYGRNVDPIKDMAFGREIPIDYRNYVDIIMT